LESAVNLYQGRYFDGCYAQEWLMIDVQYYHQQFLLAAERLTAQLLDEGDYEQALQVTYKTLGEDPLWESAYRAQMTIFHKMGRSSMVREVYKQCQDVFRQQMEGDVSPATVELYEGLIGEG